MNVILASEVALSGFWEYMFRILITVYLYWKEGEEQQNIYSDYRNLFNLEAHRANKSKDELASLRYETECKYQNIYATS